MGSALVVADLERDAERVLEERDGVIGVAEQERDRAEVVDEPAEVATIGELLVDRLGAFGVRPRQHPMPYADGDDRGLEEDVGRRMSVVEPFGELERALDVFAGSFEVATPAVAAGGPGKDVRAEGIGRE